jgi:hypothetical protein
VLGSLERYFNRQIYKNKKQEKQQHKHIFVLLGFTENGITKKIIFNIFQIWSTDRRLSLASSLNITKYRLWSYFTSNQPY